MTTETATREPATRDEVKATLTARLESKQNERAEKARQQRKLPKHLRESLESLDEEIHALIQSLNEIEIFEAFGV